MVVVVRLQIFSPSNCNHAALYLQRTRNAPSLERCQEPQAEPVSESPPRAARRAASSRGPAPRTPAAAPAAATPAGSLTRVHSDDSRLEIVRRYSAWIVKGRPYKESPIPALMKFDCERTYPKKLYDKVVEHGSVASNWLVGGWRSSHLNAGRPWSR